MRFNPRPRESSGTNESTRVYDAFICFGFLGIVLLTLGTISGACMWKQYHSIVIQSNLPEMKTTTPTNTTNTIIRPSTTEGTTRTPAPSTTEAKSTTTIPNTTKRTTPTTIPSVIEETTTTEETTNDTMPSTTETITTLMPSINEVTATTTDPSATSTTMETIQDNLTL